MSSSPFTPTSGTNQPATAANKPSSGRAQRALEILGAGAGFLLGRNQGSPEGMGQLGYQGEIPDYNLVRERVLDTSNKNMVPGAAGKRYFSDFRYMPSDSTGIAGIRQDLFNQANVGPNSLRAQNYARQGIEEGLPALPAGAGPTGINTVVGAPFNYDNRGVPTGTSKNYTMADVTDANKVQYYNDGTIYVPNYGFVNINDSASMAQFTANELPGLGETTGETPPAGGETPPAGGEAPTEPPPPPKSPPPEVPPNPEGFGVRPFDGEQLTESAFNTIKAQGGDTDNDNYISPDEWTDWTFSKGPTPTYADNWAARMEDTRTNAVEYGLDAATIANLNAPDANGVIVGRRNYYADKNDSFAFELNNKTKYVPLTFRDGGSRALDADARQKAQNATQEILDGATEVDDIVTNSPNIKAYFDYLLKLEGKTFTPNPAKAGGSVSLAGGGYLGGPTDGMADLINTSIDGQQPAALSDGEFVLPADVVSHLGNGNSDAGADVLYNMMSDIRKDRTGTTKQGTQIDPNAYLPSRGIA